MTEVVRGAVADGSWGRTFAAFGHGRWSGQVTIVAENRRFPIAFEDGAVVGASSPLATDAAVRVALIGQLITSTQVSEILRRQAAAPDRDEIELIAELAKLSPDQTARLRHRVLARRAARAFSLEHAEVVVDGNPAASRSVGGARALSVDVREVIALGARENLSEQRLVMELERLGAWFVVKPDAVAELPCFGFGDDARLILDRLVDGAGLAELEACRPGIERRLVYAVVYALVACDACEVDDAARALRDARPRAPSPASSDDFAVPQSTEPNEAGALAPVAQLARMAKSVAGSAAAAVDDLGELAPVVRRDHDRLAADEVDEAGELAPVARRDRVSRVMTLQAPALRIAPAPASRAPAPRDLVGVTIGDRYVLEQKLGVGGMGVVYRAHHTKLTRLFALKLLHRGLLADTNAVLRFEREAAIAGALRHPNVVSVVDVGVHDGVPYLAMEYADGIPLASMLDAPLPAARAIALLRQLCSGLAHAHDQGLIHRDLEPDNIIVEVTFDDETPRISDFGTAILRDSGDGERLTAAGVVLGTPAYMAPEQAMGLATMDHRVDLYALGVIAYQMLTGKLPFSGTSVEIAVANFHQPMPAMRERAPEVVVDPRLEELVRRMVAKDPAQRPADALAVRAELERIEAEPMPAMMPAIAMDAAADVAAAVTEAEAGAVTKAEAGAVTEAEAGTAKPESNTATIAMWKLSREPAAALAPTDAPAPQASATAPVDVPAQWGRRLQRPSKMPQLTRDTPAAHLMHVPASASGPRPLPPASGTAMVHDTPTTDAMPPIRRSSWPTIIVVAAAVLVAIVVALALSRAH